MALKDRFKRWILRATVLVIGGAGVAVALLQAAQEEGLTCADAQKIVNFLEARQSPYVIPFVDKVIPPACNITYEPKCSRLPDGTFCRYGRQYGPGLGGSTYDPVTKIKTPAVCDPADGQAIPCRSEDGLYKDGQYNPDDIDPKQFLFRLARKLRDEGYADDIPEP